MENQLIKYSSGYLFTGGAQVFGTLLSLIAIYLQVIDNWTIHRVFAGLFFVTLSMVFFARTYILIDKTSNSIIDLTVCLGMKFRTVTELDKYTAITLLRQLYSESAQSKFHGTTTREFVTYNIVLVNKYHLLKKVVYRAESREEAQEEAEKLAAYLQFEIQKYNPRLPKKRNTT